VLRPYGLRREISESVFGDGAHIGESVQ
jgi:hypothetical protein